MDWPDWSGRPAAIIASGPSAKKTGASALEGRVAVLAVKRNIELAPFADAVYGCDFPWWRSVHGLRDFKGLKLAHDHRAANQFGCRRIDIPDKHFDTLRFDQVGVVGSGGNSGFQALNLVAQFGATRILLIGFDLHDRGGVHWYGRNTAMGMGNPSESNFKRWRTAFAGAAAVLAARGVEVVNASLGSDLKAFPKRGLAETLEAWGV